MSQFLNNDNIPILENWYDKYLYKLNPWTQRATLERIGRSDRGANIDEAMDMIGDLIKKWETVYSAAKDSPWEVWMPYLIQTPKEGDQIRNIGTGEIYNIKNVIIDPATKQFLGIIVLETGTNPPDVLGETSISNRQLLEFVNDDRYIRFTDKFPEDHIGQTSNNQGGATSNIPPMQPTITHELLRAEPGGGKQWFGNALKELKPRIREVFPDPYNRQYHIQIRGQVVHNLVQFDCWENDATGAKRLRCWFRHFLTQNLWSLSKNGVGLITWNADVQEPAITLKRTGLHSRSTQYFMQTEDLEATRIRDLSRVNINVEPEREFGGTQTTHRAGEEIEGRLTSQKYMSHFFDRSGNYRFGSFSAIDD